MHWDATEQVVYTVYTLYKIVQLSGVECFSHMYHIGIAECTLIGLDVKQLLLCCFLNVRYLACMYRRCSLQCSSSLPFHVAVLLFPNKRTLHLIT